MSELHAPDPNQSHASTFQNQQVQHHFPFNPNAEGFVPTKSQFSQSQASFEQPTRDSHAMQPQNNLPGGFVDKSNNEDDPFFYDENIIDSKTHKSFVNK